MITLMMDIEERALGRGVMLRSSGFGYGLHDVYANRAWHYVEFVRQER
jgi:hypothetical protein